MSTKDYSVFRSIFKGILFGLFIFVIFSSCISVPVVRASPDSQVIDGPVIGIDLGTTYSCVAIHRNGETIIIPNEMGNRITPSVVSFTENERLIGDSAKNMLSSNPLNTVFDAKRLIGRLFDDKTVQKDILLFPFKVIKDNKNGRPIIEVNYKNKIKKFTAEEISSMILSKIKKIAEDYLGEDVTNAVITVPAYFNDNQRQATKDAGSIAGLNVLRIINEPTAAALAYGVHNKQTKDEINIIVYDLGGGTFDVSLLQLDNNGVYEVLATNGNTHLGGEDFDERIIKYFIKLIKKKYNQDITSNNKALAKLRREIEKSKRSLSTTSQVKIEIDNLVNGIDFSEILTRAKFEALNNDLFRKTLKPLEKVLIDANLLKSNINEIVLVGGSTRIPKIQEIVSKFFNGKKLNRGINADEAVAYGAAVQAAVIKGDNNDPLPIVIDVTPLSLGIETVGGIMTKLIERNSNIPTSKNQIFSTYVDDQPAVTIKVFQGERTMTKDNILLGQFDLKGIPPAPKGKPQIEVTFDVNVNGILKVSAKDKLNGNMADLTIDKESSTLTQEEIDKALNEAKQFEKDDLLIKQKVETKNKLENKVYTIKNNINSNEIIIDDDENKNIVLEACDNTIEWLDNNSFDADLDDLNEQLREFNDIVDPIINKAHSNPSGNDDEYDDDYGDHEEL